MAKYDNIPGCPGYYISKRGQIYSRVIPNGDDAGKLGKVWRERKVKIMVKTPTYSTENMAQMIVDGRKQKGEECPRWVNKEIPELFDYYCDGVSTMELAEIFNTNKSMINKIIRYKFKELWQGRK